MQALLHLKPVLPVLITEKPTVTYTHTVSWYYCHTHYVKDFLCSTLVSWTDEESKDKVVRLNALLTIKLGRNISQHCTALESQKEILRLSNQQKYNKALTKLSNIYKAKHQALASSLFAANEKAALVEEFNKSILTLKNRYGLD